MDRLKASVKAERDAREEAVRQLRRAERHKTDLLSAFKKQLRLINILKRQKIHVRNCIARSCQLVLFATGCVCMYACVCVCLFVVT